MCMGIPCRVVDSQGWIALCDGPAGPVSIDLALVGPQAPGTWLLTFLGAAREVISAERAAQVGDALAALEAALAGETDRIDALFGDLVGREPTLPEHLRKELP